MGGWRGADVHDVRSFGSQQFFGSAVALDAPHDTFHRSLGDIRGICYRDQLGTGAAQDCTGMMLGMAARAEERDPELVSWRDCVTDLCHGLS
jgi:hypothetical protein